MILDINGDEYVQDPPNVIQIEPSEGCTIACRFCSIRALRPGPNSFFNFMDVETIAAIGEQIVEAGWNPRIEFAVHGEPTAHPNLPLLVRTLRSYLKTNYFLLTTNGTPLIAAPKGTPEQEIQDRFNVRVAELYGAGINTIALDAYKGLKVHEYARRLNNPFVMVGDYPKDGPKFNPHPRRSAKGKRLFSIVEDIAEAEGGTHSNLSNQGGTAGPPDPSFRKPCAKTFRELTVRWDGNVAICCDDWRGRFKIGNVGSMTLNDIWHHPAMYAARKKLVRGERDFGACYGCTHRSFRVGLLPDRMGQRTLPEATEEDLDLIEMALDGAPYSSGPLRVWESGEGRPQPGIVGGNVVMVGPDGQAIQR